MFTQKDLDLLSKKGISRDNADWQISQFKNGVKPIKLVRPAKLGNGIFNIDDKVKYLQIFMESKAVFSKFVPASGAASRMFKALFEFRDDFILGKEKNPDSSENVKFFFDNLKKFAFYDELNLQCEAKGSDVETLLTENKYDIIISNLLDDSGLGYGQLPKGLLCFHKYTEHCRTAFEEHLTEGAMYARSKDNTVNIHFTVSPEHMDSFKRLSEKVIGRFENKYKVAYNIDYSVQKSSTDTIAVTPENTPFYNEDGSILFRPGGHGALIENLNEINADIIYIKNIDNVIPESKLDVTTENKRLLAGVLLDIQQQVYSLLKKLTNRPEEDDINKALSLLINTFKLEGTCVSMSGDPKKVLKLIIERLNRPLRVCGVVKNLGETGGGPFFTENEDGCVSTQIVESSQIDMNNPSQKRILALSTHFNPVDIVCSVKDFKGQKFDLNNFVDHSTCFISRKSKSGKELKALELPGLWNGAMAGWNTLFVEVPIETFNPVKFVNDLVRDMHQF